MIGFFRPGKKECDHDWVKVSESNYYKLWEESIDEFGMAQRECLGYTKESTVANGWRYDPDHAIKWNRVWEQAEQRVCLKCKAILDQAKLWEEEERMIRLQGEAEIERYNLRRKQAQEIWDNREGYED